MKRVLLGLLLLGMGTWCGCGGREEKAPTADQASDEAKKAMDEYMKSMSKGGNPMKAPTQPQK